MLNYEQYMSLSEKEKLEYSIKKSEDRIKSMRETYDSGIIFGRSSDLLCDITMREIELYDYKEKLEKLNKGDK